MLLTRGRHCKAARRKTLRSTDRRRARGVELSEEQRGRARTRSADSCAMASISRTNYHAALGRSLVATARTRSLKIWESGLGQPTDYRHRRYWKQTLKAALLAPGDLLPPTDPQPDAPDAAERRSAVRHVQIDADEQGQRLDRVLGRLLPGVPRSRLFRLIRRGEVRVNGRRADPAQR